MKSKQFDESLKALVTIFDRRDAAESVVDHLRTNGFEPRQVQLVHKDLQRDFFEVKMPKILETTGSTAESGALKGVGVGLGAAAGFGIAAAALTASPAMAIGAMIYAGMAGFMYGGVGGIDKADLDDSVNLPTPAEYQELVNEGNSLVVVCGPHDQLMRAESLMKDMPSEGSHLHRVHGHLFHEHPAPTTDDSASND